MTCHNTILEVTIKASSDNLANREQYFSFYTQDIFLRFEKPFKPLKSTFKCAQGTSKMNLHSLIST